MPRPVRNGIALLVVVLSCALVPSAHAGMVAAYPSPGVRTASNTTTISFRGVKPARLGPIKVQGSRSGIHRGRIRAHSDGRGVSFIPRRDFFFRERVTVTSPRNTFFGTKPGSPSYSFTTGELLPQGWRPEKPVPPGGETPPEWTTYKSFPFKVPKIDIEISRPGRSSGHIFLAPRTNGPMIIDDNGELVYYRPGHRTTDFRMQSYLGKPVLTWWRREEKGRKVTSYLTMTDTSYREIKRFQAGNGYTSDPHEFTMASQTTAFVNSFRSVFMDLRKFGGLKRTPVMDNIAQEIDLRTGQVLWEWHSLGNVSVGDTYWPVPRKITRPFDYFHLNSIEWDADGNILLSARHTRALYKINRRTGKVMWTLGGRSSDFRLGRGTGFSYQHDFRRHANGTFSLFDNADGEGPLKATAKSSKGMIFRINPARKTTSLVKAFYHPSGLLTPSQGNTELLPDGNVFVGWGTRRFCTEYTPDGQVVLDLEYSSVLPTYRCYRGSWTGNPPDSSIAVKSEKSGSDSLIWVSWNGDTRVSNWRVMAGGSEGALSPVANLPRSGFETMIPVTGQPDRFRLIGLDRDGRILGRSKINPLGKLTR